MTEVAKIEQPEKLLPADPMVSMIERVAMDPSADLDKLERMLAMKERMDAEAQRKAYAEAMAAAQAEMEPIARNKDNDQTRSKYADLAAIYTACKPIAARHGLSFSTYPDASEKSGFMGVRWVVRHSAGHTETGKAELPLDDKGIKGQVNKTGVHAFGSTANYARRYLFCMIFDVATKDDDGNAAGSGEPINMAQYEVLNRMIAAIGIDESLVLTAEKVTALEEIPAAKFEQVKANLEVTAKKRGVQI